MISTKFGTIGTGYEFEGVRKDGREFIGEIVKIVETKRGTLVTLMVRTHEEKIYKSVYLEECDFSVEQPVWM